MDLPVLFDRFGDPAQSDVSWSVDDPYDGSDDTGPFTVAQAERGLLIGDAVGDDTINVDATMLWYDDDGDDSYDWDVYSCATVYTTTDALTEANTTGTVNDVLAGAYSSYSRTVTVTSPPGGSGCAAGASCKEVVVSVDHSGKTRAEITLMLVDY